MMRKFWQVHHHHHLLAMLVKHFFDCGWSMAFAMSILVVIIYAVSAVLLGLLGSGIWATRALASKTTP